MEIKVTGCHDCPFCSCINNKCEITMIDNGFSIFIQTFNLSCPLKQDSITVKLHTDDKTGVHKERE